MGFRPPCEGCRPPWLRVEQALGTSSKDGTSLEPSLLSAARSRVRSRSRSSWMPPARRLLLRWLVQGLSDIVMGA